MNKRRKDKIIISAIISVVIAAMMIIVYLISQEAKNSDMPIYEVARHYEMATISGLIIYLAIFSTLIGAGKVIFDNIYLFTKSKIVALLSLILISFAGRAAGFGFMVRTFYPLTGYASIVVILLLALSYGIILIKRLDKTLLTKHKNSNFLSARLKK